MFFGKKNLQTKRVFLDYASSTPIDKGILQKINDYNFNYFANSSALYSEALSAKDKLKEAVGDCARVLGCGKDEVFFTSGGTESNNLTFLGLFESFKDKISKPHFIVTNIEHPSVLEVCKEIENRGGEVSYIPVSEEGLVSAEEIYKAIKPETVLVSVMYVNNEIGTVQPIREISKVIKKKREENNSNLPYFHTDACQSALYFSLDVSKIGVDLMTLDGLKMYGPRNTGILYVKKGIEIKPIIFGGGQQSGLRSGTQDVGSIIGMAYCLDIADFMREKESERLTKLRDYTIDKILEIFPDSSLSGSKEKRSPNNINICFKGQDAEFLVISLDVLGVSVSYSSSCLNLKENSSSYVISALGKEDCASSSLRITLGRDTTKEDMDYFLEKLKEIIS